MWDRKQPFQLSTFDFRENHFIAPLAIVLIIENAGLTLGNDQPRRFQRYSFSSRILLCIFQIPGSKLSVTLTASQLICEHVGTPFVKCRPIQPRQSGEKGSEAVEGRIRADADLTHRIVFPHKHLFQPVPFYDTPSAYLPVSVGLEPGLSALGSTCELQSRCQPSCRRFKAQLGKGPLTSLWACWQGSVLYGLEY